MEKIPCLKSSKNDGIQSYFLLSMFLNYSLINII